MLMEHGLKYISANIWISQTYVKNCAFYMCVCYIYLYHPPKMFSLCSALSQRDIGSNVPRQDSILYVCKYVCIYVCICMVCICVLCMYIYLCIYVCTNVQKINRIYKCEHTCENVCKLYDSLNVT